MFRLVVHGLSAHGCVREEGVSAVEKFIPLLAALRRLEAERCGVAGDPDKGAHGYSASVAGDPQSPLFAGYRLPWPIEVGTVHAGDWASSVPDTLVAEGRYGVAVGEDVAAAQQAFEDAIAAAAAADPWLVEHQPQVEWWGGRFDPAVTDPADPIVAAVTGAAASVTGAAPPVEGVTYGADMRLLVNVGRIPTRCCSVPATCASRTCPTSTYPSRNSTRLPKRSSSSCCVSAASRSSLPSRLAAAGRLVDMSRETPWLSASGRI